MSAAPQETKKNAVFVDFVIKFGKDTIALTLPLSATFAEVKKELADKTLVPPEKQRLLLNAPVDKDKRRDVRDSCPLAELFPAAYVQKVVDYAASPAATVAQHIKVTAMLIGSSNTTPMVDSKATAEISRLVTTTVEHGGQWYRCSFAKGYLRQTAYVCRTCIGEQRADPAHAICLACAEMCHGNHEVEEWGVRYCMRCDCCTRKCWRTPPEGFTPMPRIGDAHRTGEAGKEEKEGDEREPLVSKVSVMTSSDVKSRFEEKRKRSRSSSPLTPKRATTGSGGSPISGVRVAAVASAPSPFALHDPPPFETQAVASPVAGTLETSTAAPTTTTTTTTTVNPSQETAGADAGKAFPSAPASGMRDDTEQERKAPGTQASPPAYQPLPETNRCMFILDSSTGKPPETAVLPANAKNRYPRNPLKWCYCEDDNPSDDPDCGGIVCILCTTCFWSDHMQRLYSDQYRRVACYGDVVQGDTLAFKCTDCNTYVCTPCRLRCHRHHTVEPQFICPSREEETDNGAPPGINFSCGCRGLCSIAETVPAEELEDASTYMPMPTDVAIALMDNDVFTGFVCAHCMQENPWLMTDDPAHCYHGELPPKVTAPSAIKPIVKCGQQEEPPASAEVFPWHGMIVPVTSFTEDATCGCAPCRAAFEKFAPRATEDATEMVVQLLDECDHCGASLKDQPSFMCRTCEMAMDKAFMICKDCNALRQQLVSAKQQQQQQQQQAQQGTSNAATAVNDAPSAPEQQATMLEGQARPFAHDLDHDFVEDTYENVYALAGMQMMQTMDAESIAYLQSNWDSVKDQIQISSSVADIFGQVPLSFTNDELEAMAEANRRSSSGDKGDGSKEGAMEGESPAKREKKE